MRITPILKLTSLLVIFLCLIQTAFTQNKVIAGRVTDPNGTGVPGVTVSVKGTTLSTQTSSDGSFSINAPANATLSFTSVGYTSQDVSVSGKTAVDVTLAAANTNLSEVVVIGYGTARRRDLTGAAVTVTSKNFDRGVITTPEQLIQGKVSGLQITNNSGAPGAATTVIIRGVNSFRSGNDPLYVLDGVPLDGRVAKPGFSSAIGAQPASDPLYFINPNDIASVNILKDASEAAIYGSRAANGVIIMTTKHGAAGQPKVDFNISAGISHIVNKYKVLNGDQYRAALSSYGLANGNFGGNVDALDAILRTAPTQNYNVGFSGGNENGHYRIGLGYSDAQGIILKSGLKKYTANINGQYKFLESRKLSVDFNLLAGENDEQSSAIQSNSGFQGNIIGEALQWNPTQPLFNPDGTVYIKHGDAVVNPVALSRGYDDNTRVLSFIGNVAIGYKFTDNFQYRFLGGINRQNGSRASQIASYVTFQGVEDLGVAAYGTTDLNNQYISNTFEYNGNVTQSIRLDAIVGYDYQNFGYQGVGLSGSTFPTSTIPYYDYFQASDQASRSIGSFKDPSFELQSFFGRVKVNFNDKILLAATIRADGSSKFGSNNKYGYFPSVSGAWNVSNEKFLKDGALFDLLKLRASWGITGNSNFPAGSAVDQYVFSSGSFRQVNAKNPDLKWEQTTQYDAGVDWQVAKGKFFGTIDYFNKKTTNILFYKAPAQPGPPGAQYWYNIPNANITNNGLEVSLGYTIISNGKLDWTLSANATFMKNKFTDNDPSYTPLPTGGLFGQGLSGAYAEVLATGQPINSFFVPIYTGLDANGKSTFAKTGSDFAGNPNPTTLLGIGSDFTYGRFGASFNFNGYFGHKIYNNTLEAYLNIGNMGTRNVASNLIGGSIKEAIGNSNTPSSRYLEKGDFMKLGNLTFSYKIGNVGNVLRSTNIYITGQNLFYITKYTGFSPEVNTVNFFNGVPSSGLEYAPYPTARSIVLGISTSF